ncbi:hypothetical protein LCGC14_1496930, partial [marine sediment metagenome]
IKGAEWLQSLNVQGEEELAKIVTDFSYWRWNDDGSQPIDTKEAFHLWRTSPPTPEERGGEG